MCTYCVPPCFVHSLSTDGTLGGNVCTYCVPPCFVHRWDTGWKCVYLLCPQTGHWWECVYLLCPPLLCPQTGHWVGMCVLIVSTLALSTDGILGGNVCTYCVHPCFVHRWDTGWKCVYLLCPQTGHWWECVYLLCPPLLYPQTGHWVGTCVLIVSTDGTLGGNVCTYCVHPCFVHRRDTGWECMYLLCPPLLCPQTGHWVGMCVLIVSTDGTQCGNVCTYCVHPCFVHRWDTGWECMYLLCPPLLCQQTGHRVGMYVLIVSTLALSTDGTLGWNVCTYCVHRRDTVWECMYLLCPPLLCPQMGHRVGMYVLIVSTLALSTDGTQGGNVCTYCVHPCFVHRRDTGLECVYLLCPQTGHSVGMYVLIVSTLALSTDGTQGGNVCTYCVHPCFVNRRDTGWECMYLLCPPLLCPQTGHWVGMCVLIVSTDGTQGGNVCTYCVHPCFVNRRDTGWECMYLLCPPLVCPQMGHEVGMFVLIVSTLSLSTDGTLGGNHPTEHLPTPAETFQEGGLLLQALSSS